MVDRIEEYFLRIVLLLMKYGGMVLQYRIKFELRSQRWQKLSDFLSEKKHDILHLTLGNNTSCCRTNCNIPLKSSRLLHRAFLSVMFQNVENSCSPRSKYRCSCHFASKADLDTCNGISAWDITLTSSLLLEFIIKEPSQRQAIINLRNYRNSQDILHRGKPCMDEDEFSKTWMRVSAAIMEIAEKCEPWEFHTISKGIQTLKSDSLTCSELLQLKDFWMDIIKADDLDHIGDDICKLSSLISNLMSKVQENRTTNSTEMKNLACFTDYCLKEHSKKIYIKPQKAMAYSLKHLEDYKTIFIIGNAGIGKTQFCLNLMTEFLKKHPDVTAMILTESSQWNKIKFDSKHIIFIDDIVGKSNLNVGSFEGWSRQFDIMSSKLCNVYIIFALRKCIWQLKKDDLNDFTLFKLSNPVDLSGSKFGLTSEEKLRMLKGFCKRDGIAFENTLCEKNSLESCNQDLTRISPNSLQIIAGIDLTKGFPYLCEMFFSSKESFRMGSRFFELHSANSYEKEQVDILLGQKRYLHYVILVFISLNDKVYTKHDILCSRKKIAHLAEKMLDIMPKQVTKPEIEKCINEMINTFISVSDDGLKLRHMVTYEAVLLSFSENFPEEFLDSIDKTVLFAYVRSSGYVAEENEIVVQLDNDMTKSLARKLLKVYGTDAEKAFTDVYKHPAFHDKNLVISFLDVVESVDCFKAFLGSFVAGACMDKKDILACETIERFCGHYAFDPQTFNIVVNSDLIHTCFQFLNNERFKKCLFEVNESGVMSRLCGFLIIACWKGSLRCVKALLNICNKENVLHFEVDRDLKNLMKPFIWNIEDSINDIVGHHSHCEEDDWNKVLIQLGDLLFPSYPDKQTFYENILTESLVEEKFDLAIDYLEKLNPFTSSALNFSIWWCILFDNSLFFNAICGKVLSGNITLDSRTAESMFICCAFQKNEEMFLTLYNKTQYDFYSKSESTVLHACEEKNFSSSTLLKLLQRAEGQRMFTSKDFLGRTPVQCRTSYQDYCRTDAPGILMDSKLYDEKSKYIKLHGRRYSFKRPGEKGTFRCPYKNDYDFYCKKNMLNRDFFLRGVQFNSFISGAYSFPFKDFTDDSLIAYSSLEY